MNSPTRFVVSETETFAIYEGSRDDLIGAGVATASMFPEGRKRKKWHLGPDIPKGQNWATDRLKGNRYRVQRFHEYRDLPQLPAKWNPMGFRADLADSAVRFLGVLELEAAGGIEEKVHGHRTHRFCNKDLERIRSLSHQLVDTIMQARVIAAGQDQRPELRVVK